jgi:predicted acetyltransferase
MTIEIRPAGREELPELVMPVLTAFGLQPSEDRIARRLGTPEFDTLIGAYDEGATVGGMGSYSFDMTVPGADGGVPVPTAGLTMVGVLPTHRRRGVLTGMMRRYLDDLRRRGLALSALFASEGPIYGRFGYGVASLRVDVSIERDRSHFLDRSPTRGRIRLIGETEAASAFPSIWDQVRKERPGMLSRSAGWFRFRRIEDPEWARSGRGLLQRALLEIDGRPAAYALYRHAPAADPLSPIGSLDVIEAIGASPEASRAIWRYLLDIDVVSHIKAHLLPIDHPLLFLTAEPRRLGMCVSDGLWVRLVDVEAALSARRLGAGGPLVLSVKDAFCPWNEGCYKIGGGAARRTDGAADIELDVEALGAAYLGAFPFTQLAEAGRVIELREGALRRADALFRGTRAPWCPEMF